MLENYDDILNIKEVCAILKVDRKLVYKLIYAGKLSAIKVGSTYRIPKYCLIRYIDEGLTCPPNS